MPKVSIIVPVYKVEKYLHRCVDSIRNQSLKEIEIILVDDGSPDACGAICDEYALIDKRIKVIHKTNGGLSDARNAGLDVAQGKYVGFVDSDDYIEHDMFNYLYSLCEEYKANIATCGWFDEYPDTVFIHSQFPIVKTMTQKEYLREVLLSEHAGFPIPFRLYNRIEVFSDVRFPVGMYYEDSYVFFDILKKTENIVVSSVAKYHYIRHEGTITTSSTNLKACEQHIYVDKRNRDYVRVNYPCLLPMFESRVQQTNYIILKRLLNTNQEDAVKLRKKVNFELILNAKWIIKDPKLNIKGKIIRLMEIIFMYAPLGRQLMIKLRKY